MRILFLTQYYPPETGASQNRLSYLARHLKNSGHDVVVVTALPNYPRGEFYPGYRGRIGMVETDRGIRIVRTWVYATKSRSFALRLINYFSFCLLSVVAGLLAVGKIDVIYVDSPPLFLGISGWLLSKLKRAVFVFNVADLWPESAVALGMLRNPWLIRLATALEEGLYRRAELLTGQTNGIIESLRRRCPQIPVELLTNGVTPELLEELETARDHRAQTRTEFGFGDKFIVAYTGVHGIAQGLDTLLLAAGKLNEFEGIKFVFFGDGPDKQRLQLLARGKNLRNVEFFPNQEWSRMPAILCAIDASIVPLRKDELFKMATPFKLFEALGAGIPAVVSIEGEAKSLVERSGGGLAVEPENAEAMADAVLRLYRDPDLCRKLGEKGRSYLVVHYNRKIVAEKFERLLQKFAPPVKVPTATETIRKDLDLASASRQTIGEMPEVALAHRDSVSQGTDC